MQTVLDKTETCRSLFHAEQTSSCVANLQLESLFLRCWALNCILPRPLDSYIKQVTWIWFIILEVLVCGLHELLTVTFLWLTPFSSHIASQ